MFRLFGFAHARARAPLIFILFFLFALAPLLFPFTLRCHPLLVDCDFDSRLVISGLTHILHTSPIHTFSVCLSHLLLVLLTFLFVLLVALLVDCDFDSRLVISARSSHTRTVAYHRLV